MKMFERLEEAQWIPYYWRLVNHQWLIVNFTIQNDAQ